MKKINRFLMIYMVVITVLCIYMCYLAFSANEKKDNLKEVRSQITTTAEKKQNKAVKKVKATFDHLFELAPEKHIPTIGVGDGGNEPKVQPSITL